MEERKPRSHTANTTIKPTVVRDAFTVNHWLTKRRTFAPLALASREKLREKHGGKLDIHTHTHIHPPNRASASTKTKTPVVDGRRRLACIHRAGSATQNAKTRGRTQLPKHNRTLPGRNNEWTKMNARMNVSRTGWMLPVNGASHLTAHGFLVAHAFVWWVRVCFYWNEVVMVLLFMWFESTFWDG